MAADKCYPTLIQALDLAGMHNEYANVRTEAGAPIPTLDNDRGQQMERGHWPCREENCSYILLPLDVHEDVILVPLYEERDMVERQCPECGTPSYRYNLLELVKIQHTLQKDRTNQRLARKRAPLTVS